MSRPRVMLAFAMTILVLISKASGDEDNQRKTTFRTGIESFLQGVIPSSGSDSSNEDDSCSGSINDDDSDSDDDSDDYSQSSSRNDSNSDSDGSSGSSENTGGFGQILDLVEENFHAIFPGTLWCGGGNIADDEQDLGLFKKTDACCRKHDNCPSNIGAGKCKGPLENNGLFTRSACSCDREFYECLKNADTILATNIGTTYFNILRPQCFKRAYPIESCEEYGSNRIVQKKCVEYNFDESQNKTLQWFDNPDF